MVYTLCFFSSKFSLFHNSNVFGSCIIRILYTGCAKTKKNNSGSKRLILKNNAVSSSNQNYTYRGSPFIVSPNTTALSRRKYASGYPPQLTVTVPRDTSNGRCVPDICPLSATSENPLHLLLDPSLLATQEFRVRRKSRLMTS